MTDVDDDAGNVRRAAGTLELVTAPQFFALLRHVVRFREQAMIEDPLGAAVDQIKNNPAFAQSRLLMRILAALPSQQGEFRRAEAAALDAATSALVIALMDIHAAGARPPQDWMRAIRAAEAASG